MNVATDEVAIAASADRIELRDERGRTLAVLDGKQACDLASRLSLAAHALEPSNDPTE